MSPSGTKNPTNPTNPSSPATRNPNRCYKKASNSRWELQPLFQLFLENRPADTILAVQERRFLVSWDLMAIHHLRRCLRTWILNGIPGDAIGAFLVTVLYEQDFHLDYLLTMMVRDGRNQVHIARRLLASYQIRDKAGEPIWDNLTIYPDDFGSKSSATRVQKAAGMSAAATEDLPYRIPTPQPADPRWPLFMSSLSDPELEDLVDKLGDSQHADEEGLPPLFTGVRKEDIPIIEAFRRFTLHKNDASDDLPLFESESDKTKLTSQTNMTQNKPLLHPSSEKYLRLPFISHPPTPPPSSVRVSTFIAERKPRIQYVDQVSGMSADIEQVEDNTAASDTKPSVNLDKTLPQISSSHTHIPCYVVIDNETPQPPPQLKKKKGIEDLRKARERHD